MVELSGKAFKAGGIVGIIAFILFMVIILMSFSSCEYYQYGFKRRKSTGNVDTSKVYGGGKHFVGPDYMFKHFPATAHIVNLTSVAIFTSERLEVWVTVRFLYYLRKDELPLLHKAYDIYYEPILQKNSLDALKVAASGFSTWEFVRDRLRVENVLRKAVTDRLGGKCCELDCAKTDIGCAPGCKPRNTCKEADKGFFARVEYFYLQSVSIPSSVIARYMKALVLKEETETEQFRQEAVVVEKQTDKEVKDIMNAAAEIAQNATAQSELAIAQAHANATATVETARGEGLRSLYRRLGLTSQEHRSTFDYLRTLKEMDMVHLGVDFQNLIMGPVSSGSVAPAPVPAPETTT